MPYAWAPTISYSTRVEALLDATDLCSWKHASLALNSCTDGGVSTSHISASCCLLIVPSSWRAAEKRTMAFTAEVMSYKRYFCYIDDETAHRLDCKLIAPKEGISWRNESSHTSGLTPDNFPMMSFRGSPSLLASFHSTYIRAQTLSNFQQSTQYQSANIHVMVSQFP